MILCKRDARDAVSSDNAGHPVVGAVCPPDTVRDVFEEWLDAAPVDAVDDPLTLFGVEEGMDPVVRESERSGKLTGTQVDVHPRVSDVPPFRPSIGVEKRVHLGEHVIAIPNILGDQAGERGPQGACSRSMHDRVVAVGMTCAHGVTTGKYVARFVDFAPQFRVGKSELGFPELLRVTRLDVFANIVDRPKTIDRFGSYEDVWTARHWESGYRVWEWEAVICLPCTARAL